MPFHQHFTFIIELIGVFSFVLSGSFAAIQKKLDPFGVLTIGFITSVGGGTIRDLLLGVPIFWMQDPFVCGIIFISSIFAMIFKSVEKNFYVPLFIFDSLGLGLFTVIGIEKGINSGLSPIICISLGAITGCFGGILRDIFLNKLPLFFRKEIYATASILGGFSYVLMQKFTGFSSEVIRTLTIAIVVIIRTLSVRYKWHIPRFYEETKRQ